MKKGKRAVRSCALALALLLCAGGAVSCKKEEKPAVTTPEEEETEVDISGEATALFDDATAALKGGSYHAEARSYATVREDASDGAFLGSYLQSFRRDVRGSDEGETQIIVSAYASGSETPEAVPEGEQTLLYVAYVKDGYCHYDFGEEKRKEPFLYSYPARLGLYSLANYKVDGISAIRTDSEAVVTLKYSGSACERSQDSFVAAMLLALFGEEIALGYSDMTLKARIDPETHRMSSYTIRFDALTFGVPIKRISFTYSEAFSDYGNSEPLNIPDLSDY